MTRFLTCLKGRCIFVHFPYYGAQVLQLLCCMLSGTGVYKRWKVARGGVRRRDSYVEHLLSLLRQTRTGLWLCLAYGMSGKQYIT